MTKKFNSFYLTLAVVLTGALVLGSAFTAFGLTDDSPDYVGPSESDVKMISFTVTNPYNDGNSQDFQSVTVNYDGDNNADVDTVYVYDSSDTVVNSVAFNSDTKTIGSLAESIPDGDSQDYYLAIDLDSDGATTGNSVDIEMESITGEGNLELDEPSLLPFATTGTTVTSLPTYDAAITGDDVDGNSTAADTVTLSFSLSDGATTLVDSTIDAADFEVNDTTPDSYTLKSSGDVVTLTLANDLATSDTPKVELLNGAGIEDDNGLVVEGDSAKTISNADDGLKPKVESGTDVVYSNGGKGSQDTLTVTFSEDLGLVGTASDYSVDYNGRTVDPDSVARDSSNDDEVVVTIPDQTMETDPGNSFEVTVDNPGNVYDQTNNSTDTANVSATSATVDDFNDAKPAFVSATATGDTTVEIVFDEPIAIPATEPDWSTAITASDPFSATDATVTGDDQNVLEVTTDSLDNTAYSASNLDILADTVEDMAEKGNAESTSNDIVDGQDPELLGANTGDTLNGSSTARDRVVVEFSEELDGDTVEDADFEVSGDASVDGLDDGTQDSATYILTLDAKLDTDATPDVTLVDGESVSDTASEANTLSGPVSVTDTADYLQPFLEKVDWKNVDDDSSISEMDELTFTFSEPIDESTLSSTNIDSRLNPATNSTYGSGPLLSWNDDSTVLTVTVASGVDLNNDEQINPQSEIKDDSANSNGADTGTTPSIQSLSDPVWVEETDERFADIQAAVDDADTSDGDTIVVGDDYDADDNFPVSITKEVTIKAEADGDDVTPEVDVGGEQINVDASNVTIEGLKVTGDGDYLIKLRQSVNAVASVTIKGNEFVPTGDYGMHSVNINGASGTSVTNNDFLGNSKAGGLYIEDHNSGEAGYTIEDNVFEDLVFGVQLLDVSGTSSKTAIKNNEFTGMVDPDTTDIWLDGGAVKLVLNDDASGLTDGDIGELSITNNDLMNSRYGIAAIDAGDTDQSTAVLNTSTIDISDNDISGNGEYGVYVEGDVDLENGNNLDATENYWGAESGPGGEGLGSGDDVSTDVTYDKWLNIDDEAMTEGETQVYLSAEGWNMISVNRYPFSPEATELFGETDGSDTFFYNPDTGNYLSGAEIDVEPRDGYWYYASTSDLPVDGSGNPTSGLTNNLNASDNNNAYKPDSWSTVMTKLEYKSSWEMISAPFDVDWGKVKVSDDSVTEEDDWMTVSEAQSKKLLSKSLYHFDTDAGEYTSVEAPDGYVDAGKGYWVKTGENVVEGTGITLKFPFEPSFSPTSEAMVAAASPMEAAGFEPVPEGADAPPAPPASSQGVSGELKATAAVTSEGVTFEVSGADVSSISVQVFSTNGAEVFSDSAEGSSLSWDAEVANGVYLYGATAEVNGEVKPLGIQKLLILS